MSNIGSKIKELRNAKNLTQRELAELIGEKSGNIIYNWENGIGKPDCGKLPKLCTALEVSSDVLLGFENSDNIPTAIEWQMIKKYRELDIHGKNAVSSILNIEHGRIIEEKERISKAHLLEIDFYRIPASAGFGTFLENDTPDKIYIKDTEKARLADYVLEVSGDSMEPTFSDGDKVLVKKQDTVEIGEIGIFVLNGDAFIKELGINKLISHNKKYKERPILEVDSSYCCGKVLGVAE